MNIETQIKTAFERGEKLTVLDAFHQYRTFELKHFINRLRKSGLNIVDEWQTDGKKRWKKYWLNGSVS